MSNKEKTRQEAEIMIEIIGGLERWITDIKKKKEHKQEEGQTAPWKQTVIIKWGIGLCGLQIMVFDPHSVVLGCGFAK